MDESAAALRPLDDASPAIDRLREYESTADLGPAIETVRAAVERTLRLRLRSDESAPERDRLAALSATDLSLDEVVKSLRSRDLISLDTAGTVHQLDAAAARARVSGPRAADADVALRAVTRLRKELETGGRVPLSTDPAPRRESTPDADGPTPPERRGRWVAWLAAGLAVLFLALSAWVLTRGGAAEYDAAVAAFRSGRLDSAEVAFQRVLEDRPADVDALLYMARIQRRQGRTAESAGTLRKAAGIEPADPDIRRELGHLFMDLRQPRAAVAQYERALEADPEEPRTWAALISALRAAGDPRAERLLADAPPEVQALLGRGGS